MKRFEKLDIVKIFNQIKDEGVSMRRRFALYIISAVALVLSLILLLLNVFGVLNPTNAHVMDILETQLSSYADDIERDYNVIAAHSISFSEQIGDSVENFLSDNSLKFEDLKNNSEALFALQSELYKTVYLNCQALYSHG